MARKVVLRSLTSPTIAYEARATGLIKEIPKLRTEFASIAAAAEFVGLKTQTLRQALHRARKENGGTNAPATVHGMCFSYTEEPGTNVSI